MKSNKVVVLLNDPSSGLWPSSPSRGEGNGVRGFTLIELLVVVLIIGILAAVAVPQYQKAVMKANLASDLALFVEVVNSMERYYLANGIYPIRVGDLDISLSCKTLRSGTDGDYCYMEQPLTIKLWEGAYLHRNEKYKLEIADSEPNRTNQGITCWPVKGNQIAQEICASYSGQSWTQKAQTGFENVYYTLWKR